MRWHAESYADMHLARGQLESPMGPKSRSHTDMKAHAARINTLLDGEPVRAQRLQSNRIPPIVRVEDGAPAPKGDAEAKVPSRKPSSDVHLA